MSAKRLLNNSCNSDLRVIPLLVFIDQRHCCVKHTCFKVISSGGTLHNVSGLIDQGIEAADTSSISGEARTQRAHLLILCGPRDGAELTVDAPSSAAVTAALGLGHQVPVTGGHLTQRGQNFSEAEAFPVI